MGRDRKAREVAVVRELMGELAETRYGSIVNKRDVLKRVSRSDSLEFMKQTLRQEIWRLRLDAIRFYSYNDFEVRRSEITAKIMARLGDDKSLLRDDPLTLERAHEWAESRREFISDESAATLTDSQAYMAYIEYKLRIILLYCADIVEHVVILEDALQQNSSMEILLVLFRAHLDLLERIIESGDESQLMLASALEPAVHEEPESEDVDQDSSEGQAVAVAQHSLSKLKSQRRQSLELEYRSRSSKDQDVSFNQALLMRARLRLNTTTHKKRIPLITKSALPVESKHWFLRYLSEAPDIEIDLIMALGIRMAREADRERAAQIADEAQTATANVPVEEAEEVLEDIGQRESQQDPRVAKLINLFGYVDRVVEEVRDDVPADDWFTLRAVINSIGGYDEQQVEALDFIRRKYGKAALQGLFINPSLMIEGPDRARALMKELLSSVAHFIPFPAEHHSLTSWFDPTRTRDNSFVRANRDNLTRDVSPISGWVKEFHMVVVLREQYGSHVKWNPAENPGYSRRYKFGIADPDAINVSDRNNAILYEIFSIRDGGTMRTHFGSYEKKCAQLRRYREVVEKSDLVGSVELIVMGKLEPAVRDEFLRIMDGVPFTIRFVDYHSLEPSLDPVEGRVDSTWLETLTDVGGMMRRMGGLFSLSSDEP